MKAQLVIHNIGTLYTPTIKPPVKGKDMSKILEIKNAFIAVKNGKIIDFGDHDYSEYITARTVVHDANGCIAMPGFIDSHTHLVHSGSRENEYAKLRAGVPYLDILKAGGGILGTVNETRKATFEHLYVKGFQSLDQMMSYGVTAIEAKSGYGLNLLTETKQLEVAQKINEIHPVLIKSTYMGAHAVPKEYQGNKEGYIDKVIEDMAYIKENELADAVDVFCETGVFSIEETRRILQSAKNLGFSVKLHADEIDPLGGAGLGVELHATSVDHLMAISDADILKLAKSNTIANLLPGTSFYLNKGYARARKMIDENCAVSIAGDYNPGSCPTENFQFIMHLASNELKMNPKEILNAVTINPAYHLGLSETKGSIEIGKDADILLMDIPNLNYLFYHFGINHVKHVLINGKFVVFNRRIVRKK
ncbi:MAG: imidazolonepropionase [Tenericutes bacterium HGW-Tenericutes-3]|nr:MAG: imidazolonepropionase [Tenericutes bacterium HGW-Tenericutes-3]